MPTPDQPYPECEQDHQIEKDPRSRLMSPEPRKAPQRGTGTSKGAPARRPRGLGGVFLITTLLRNETIEAGDLALSAGATLALGAGLVLIAGRLYHREALL